MPTALAIWFTHQRSTLQPLWAELLATPQQRFAPVAAPFDDGAVTTLSVATVTVSELYAAIIQAAEGDTAALDALLQNLALDEGTEGSLEPVLELARQLQRSAHALLRQTVPVPAEALDLVEALDDLFDHTTSLVISVWSEHNSELIREREFIAASLDSASASADRRALQLQSLNVISQQLSAILEEEQLIELLMANLFNLTGITLLTLWQPDAAGTSLLVCKSSGTTTLPNPDLQVAVDHPSDLLALAVRKGQAQFVMQPDTAQHGAWLLPDCGVLAMPMLVSEQVVAVVGLQDPDPINHLRLQQDLVQAVVSQTAIALQNARLYAEVRALNVDLERRVAERTRELQDEKDRLATIHQISVEVSSTLDLDSLLETSLQILADITHTERASVMLVEQDGSLLVTRKVLGVEGDPQNYVRFPIGSGVAGWVAQNRKGVLIDDVSRDERWVTAPGMSVRRREGAMVAVPLVVQGDVLGVLSLSHNDIGFFTEGHLRLLSACAGSIAIGVNNANLFQMISAEAERRYELLDRQEKESSQIQAILQSLSDGVIVCDLEGVVLTINPAAAEILARSLDDMLLWSLNLHEIIARYMGNRAHEMPLSDLLHRPMTRDDQPRFFQSMLKVGVRTVALSLGPVLKENGQMLGALLVLRDITREVEADRLKTEFIGTMSHELRTPMTAIKGFTQLLSMGGLGPLNETQREFVNTIYNNTERMIALINDVLDITKIEAGSADLEWRALHLAEALSGVVAELRPLASERNHELSISIPPGLPLVRADAHRLHQILYNLLVNAIKYTPKGGQISVTAHETSVDQLPEEIRDQVPHGQRYTQLSVQDNGVGISEEDLPRVFDRFYRTENTLKIEAGGTGLGLSLARPLIELLGGKIWARSTLGEGSTFSFVLPAAEQQR
ncbi:MAG: GAF domain-containing protein [Candidatus Viridilinea halotolerans]|uniref:histidine kinase n=1 Tax=Candidatus Viridilinea halotolerans TaxID=2491704 RepID=A0A426U200_9CHLR|nr:MAG: GAF domain-containing protein [Candidatus Viridilinea halotolerans]